jgi:hypothetical protein
MESSRSISLTAGQFIAVAALALFATASKAEDWQFAVTPYLWLPNVEAVGTTERPPDADGEPQFEIGPVDYLEHLDFVLMVAGEARRGDWIIRADAAYVDFGNERSAVRSISGPGGIVERPLDANTNTSLSGLVSQLTLGYGLETRPDLSVEVFGGLRYLDVSLDLDWRLDGPADFLPQSGHVSQDANPLDAIVGARARVGFGDSQWFMPLHADIGTGDSNLTWQILVGAGYTFSWGDLLLAYRHLDYDADDGDLLESLALSGPAFGATFRF